MNGFLKTSWMVWALVLTLTAKAVAADPYEWTFREPGAGEYFQAIAMDKDGERILVGGAHSAFLYLSTDGGDTWTARSPSGTEENWTGLAMTQDGVTAVAAAYNGLVYLSGDGGETWRAINPAGDGAAREWSAVAISADGEKLIAAANESYLFASADGGASWTKRDIAGKPLWWNRAAMSADGTRAIACEGHYADEGQTGTVFRSANSGDTWKTLYPAGMGQSDKLWNAVALSDNGERMIAAVFRGFVYTSDDGGGSWTLHPLAGIGVEAVWQTAAMTPDGAVMAVAASSDYGFLYTSANGGASWTQHDPTGQGSPTYWQGIALSHDADKILGVTPTGVYIGEKSSGGPHTVTFAAGTGGTVNGKTVQSVAHGGDCAPATAVPETGYAFYEWRANGMRYSQKPTIIVTEVNADLTMEARFAAKNDLVTIWFIAADGGFLEGATPQVVIAGSDCARVAAVPRVGYAFRNWTKNGKAYSDQAALIVESVTQSERLVANFVPAPAVGYHTVTFLAEFGGTLSGKTPQTVYDGERTDPVRAVPDLGYQVLGWFDEYSRCVFTRPKLALTDVRNDRTITARFTPKTGTVASKFSSSHSEKVKNGEIVGVDKYAATLKAQLTNWAAATANTAVFIRLGDRLFSRTLGAADAKSLKLNGAKGGAATFTEFYARDNGKTVKTLKVRLSWNAKGLLTVNVNAAPSSDVDANMTELSAAPPGAAADILPGQLEFGDETFAFPLPYGGEKTLKSKVLSDQVLDTMGWAIKGTVKGP